MSRVVNLGPVGFNPTGVYDITRQYKRLDVVAYQGSSYVATDDSVGQVPSDNSDYWDIIAAGGLGQDDIINNLTSSATDKVLAANQGRVLKDLIGVNTGNISNLGTNLSDEALARENADTNLQSQITSLASGSPLIANSTSEMTDTTKIYVNTNDGHWYYYDGTSWTDGGVYQATEIGNNSISILKLDNKLVEAFNKDYENVSFTLSNTGYAHVSSNNLVLNTTDTGYHYGTLTLDANTIYAYGYKNIGEMIALIVIDPNDSNKIVYSTDDGETSGTRNVNTVFKTNKSGLVAYFSKRNVNNAFEENLIILTKLKDIELNYTKESKLTKLKTLSNYYIARTGSVGAIPNLTSDVNGSVDVYKISKGSKYQINSANWIDITGLIIADKSFNTVYRSSSSEIRPLTKFTYEFVAEDDYYIFVSNYVNKITSSVYLLNVPEGDKYLNKKWAVIGDSLTAFNTLGSDVKNYVNYVSEKLGLNYVNYGVGGTGYRRGYTSNNAFYQRVSNIDEDADIVTIFGSFNDLGLEDGTYGYNIIGDITDTTNATLCGAINLTLDNLISRCPNALIGIILPTPWQTYSLGNTYSVEYTTKLKQICEKRSIPCLDLYNASNLRPYDETFRESFYKNGDGVHPNTIGHKRFSNEIVEFLRSILY